MDRHPDLHDAVLAALGRPCATCSTVIRVLLETPHDRHAFDRAVSLLACPGRDALTALIRKHGLPPPRRLRSWLRVVAMLNASRAVGWTLQGHAYEHGVEPSVLYRAVAAVTPEPWSTVRAEGVDGWLARLGQEVRRGNGVQCSTLTMEQSDRERQTKAPDQSARQYRQTRKL